MITMFTNVVKWSLQKKSQSFPCLPRLPCLPCLPARWFFLNHQNSLFTTFTTITTFTMFTKIKKFQFLPQFKPHMEKYWSHHITMKSIGIHLHGIGLYIHANLLWHFDAVGLLDQSELGQFRQDLCGWFQLFNLGTRTVSILHCSLGSRSHSSEGMFCTSWRVSSRQT